uniref:Uncharacterized protein n=1 Tax=Hippocampus comes TaxID=109280 RepID=A0A3Q3D5R5_HIPCM
MAAFASGVAQDPKSLHPFMVVSLVGQELLAHGFYAAAAEALEAALQIGTCSLKMRGSIFSALSAAYWSLGYAEKSLDYMKQDLDVARTLGECQSLIQSNHVSIRPVISVRRALSCRLHQFLVNIRS